MRNVRNAIKFFPHNKVYLHSKVLKIANGVIKYKISLIM